MASSADPHARLVNQTLARPLTGAEAALAAALEEVYATGTHAPGPVAEALNMAGVARPSGGRGPWTAAVLEAELAAINAALDAAYARDGVGA